MSEIKTTSSRSKALRLILFALVLTAIFALMLKEPPYNNIDNAQLEAMLNNNVPIYDVRRPDEWKQTGIVEGSRLLTVVDNSGRLKPDFLPRFTSQINKNDPVILICRTGSRTSKLAYYLTEELGYTNIFNVDDGINRWIREKRPVRNFSNSTVGVQNSKTML